MIDVRQIEELQASGSVKGSINIPKGVIEFRLNNNDEVSFQTSIYVYCAVGVRSAIAGYNLKKIGVHHVEFSINEDVEKKFLKKAFVKFGPVGIVMHMAMWNISHNLAKMFKIP